MPTDEHLPGCPAALSIVGARDDCRCADLAARFGLPTREECLADPDPARRHARWSESRAEAGRRYQQLLHDVATEERTAFEGYLEAVAHGRAVELDIRTARKLARMLAEGRLP